MRCLVLLGDDIIRDYVVETVIPVIDLNVVQMVVIATVISVDYKTVITVEPTTKDFVYQMLVKVVIYFTNQEILKTKKVGKGYRSLIITEQKEVDREVCIAHAGEDNGFKEIVAAIVGIRLYSKKAIDELRVLVILETAVCINGSVTMR